jgi:hypothetical protein
MIERLRLTQPNLDTKPGTVARDLFIDNQADQIDRLYSSVSLVAQKQSPEIATGKDLDRWANNFGITRRTGSPSNGIAVFAVNDISSDIPIPSGTIVTSRNGLQYKTIGSFLFSSAEKNKFSATANRLRSALNVAGITDAFAIEVPVQALRSGTSGNISSLQIIEHNLPESVKVINLSSFNGGSNVESDASFRARVFAVFSGSNTGTAFGYRNAALSVNGVNDALIVEPGNTLMQRDGTEVIEVNDGSFRILNSGTGGKVDVYILGKKLEEIVESFIYSDVSGSGNATDERNDYTPGQTGVDSTLTSEERRVLAFKTGNLPMQPVNSVISVTGSRSGILAQKTTDSNGVVSGNYELIKDLNVNTGGSPFGFDKIRFISNSKIVSNENIIKNDLNSIDSLKYNDIQNISESAQYINITNENSTVSSADKSIIKLNHSPVVSVSRVLNKTTGEVYVVTSQNLDTATGLNLSGQIVISGKTLPSPSDILSADYTWKMIFDKYVEYNGTTLPFLFKDEKVVDSIDWSPSNGISLESCVVAKTDDDLEFIVVTGYPISRVLSVFSAITITSSVSTVLNVDGSSTPGVVIPNTSDSIVNIVSIKNQNGLELYKTVKSDGSFSGRTIVLPSDTSSNNSTSVAVIYNSTELFDIEDSDASYSNTTITLSSEDILSQNGLQTIVNDLYLSQEDIFVTYVAEIENILPSQTLSFLPVNGSSTSNVLLNNVLSAIDGSNQPVFYKFSDTGVVSNISKFGPTRISLSTSGTSRPGKIKINGTSLTRLTLTGAAGVIMSGLTLNLTSLIRDALGLSSLPSSIGIARVDSMVSLDNSDTSFGLMGQALSNTNFSFGFSDVDQSLSSTYFKLPSTSLNGQLSVSSGEILEINLLIYNTNDYEDLYFSGNNTVVTNKVFARIDRMSVSSGFRTPGGSLVGSLIAVPMNQPGVGLSYLTSYDFKSPKEGERLTIRYNLNKLISSVTVETENVRSITADVLVKESPSLPIDISGEILINENVNTSSNTILENVSNAVVNLLNSGSLGGTVDYSDVISVAAAIPGVDSINISLFNYSGEIGRRTFIKALDNQAISAGNVSFRAVSRQNFRIS